MRKLGQRKRTNVAGKGALLSLGLFSLFFLIGLYMGRFFAARQAAQVIPELKRYLDAYAETAGQSGRSAGQIARAFFLYFRYPLAVFLLGFASFGVLVIPPLGALMAFSFSYSVSCFVAALGGKGVLLALSLLGLRYLITLPCFFLLGQGALRTSWELTLCTLGQGRRRAAALYDKTYFLRFFFAAAALALGALLDLWLTPWLLSLAGG